MARPLSDIDPHRLDLASGKRRKRKDRSKPEAPAALKEAKADAEAKIMSLPINPGVMQELHGDGWRTTAPHNDLELWDLELGAAFGTRSRAVMRVFIEHLRRLCPEFWDEDSQRWKSDETTWNMLLAMVADHQPENTTQAALAAQLANVHLMQMKLAQQAVNRGGSVMERDAALAAKLARTFSQLCETMVLLKGGKKPVRQTIKVEKTLIQEVHYHDHRREGGEKNESRPQEPRADTIEGRAKVSGPCEVHRLPVPGTSDAREEGLPQARRAKSGREAGQG